jgi:hypothetical protein
MCLTTRCPFMRASRCDGRPVEKKLLPAAEKLSELANDNAAISSLAAQGADSVVGYCTFGRHVLGRTRSPIRRLAVLVLVLI